MPTKNWSYVTKWENPRETINAINNLYGKITSSPVFFGYWAKVSLYRVALKDYGKAYILLSKRTPAVVA